MVRKRTQLLNLFPEGAVTATQASEALQASQGNVELARQYLEDALTVLVENQKKDPTLDEVDAVKNELTSVQEQQMPCKKDKAMPKEETVDTRSQKAAPRPVPKTISAAPTTGLEPRRPPTYASAVNNLSDRQYCCVWWVEVYEDGYRPDIARSLLARVARHVNPILRERGWRVKRLMESASSRFLGCCTANDRRDADAASVNIQLNLRRLPNKHCQTFRSFGQILAVMFHEITHISMRHHEPSFWKLMEEIKQQYKGILRTGEITKETEDYGCKNTVITPDGEVSTIEESANLPPDDVAHHMEAGDCGMSQKKNRRRQRRGSDKSKVGNKKQRSVKAAGIQANIQSQKRRPLLKGAKMVDKRTNEGKALVAAKEMTSARDLAFQAALTRMTANPPPAVASSTGSGISGNAITNLKEDNTIEVASSGESDDDENEEESESEPEDHPPTCGCRACEWDKRICGEIASTIRDWN